MRKLCTRPLLGGEGPGDEAMSGLIPVAGGLINCELVQFGSGSHVSSV